MHAILAHLQAQSSILLMVAMKFSLHGTPAFAGRRSRYKWVTYAWDSGCQPNLLKAKSRINCWSYNLKWSIWFICWVQNETTDAMQKQSQKRQMLRMIAHTQLIRMSLGSSRDAIDMLTAKIWVAKCNILTNTCPVTCNAQMPSQTKVWYPLEILQSYK